MSGTRTTGSAQVVGCTVTRTADQSRVRNWKRRIDLDSARSKRPAVAVKVSQLCLSRLPNVHVSCGWQVTRRSTP